jgi:hypothetical protein
MLKLCALIVFCNNAFAASQTYSLVQDIDRFDGSSAAWHLLETNGFVVADPVYDQIFEPYLDSSLPPFITADSAWDTFQTLLAAGVKQLELQNQPDADFFAKTTELSGVELFVACPELRSPDAVRVLRKTFGGTTELAMETVNYMLPSNNLASESLRLLATLQKPVSSQSEPVFRSEAWADEQLWTQLGAWIEQSHPPQSHADASDLYEPGEDGPKLGVVAPYPEFFAGLARLSRDAEVAMEKAGLDEPFDSKAIAQQLLNAIFVQQGLAGNGDEEMAKMAATGTQFKQFTDHYAETHHAGGGENSPAAQQLLKTMETVARRCLSGTVPTEADRVILKGFYDERATAPRLLRDFALTCDKLAELARKQRDGAALSDEDRDWIANYGTILARFHSSLGNGLARPDDDSSSTRNLGTNSAGTSVLCAGLGHPETLYIILPAEGRLHLYRGAVLAYREEARAVSAPVDGKSQPPGFTASFRAEKSPAEILETLAAGIGDRQGLRDIQENLTALRSRVTDADLPALIESLGKSGGILSGSPISSGLATAIARLNWKSSQNQLLTLLTNDDGVCATAVTSILLQHPEWLDANFLSANFDLAAPRARRVYALLLGRLQPSEQTRAVLSRALRDDSPGVRWQAVLAIANAPWHTEQKVPPLLDRLNDTNELVASAAARAFGKIGTATVAPILFSNLQQRLQMPASADDKLQEQRAAVQDFVLGNFNGQTNLFDPDNLLVRAQMPRRWRFLMDVRREQQFTKISALIGTLGDLHYQPAGDTLLGLLGGPNAGAADAALKKIAPEKLAARLTTIAADKTALPQARDEALLLLSDAAGANPMAGIIPLLDDQTIVPGPRPMPGREWRICDRAATTLTALIGRPLLMAPMMPIEDRDKQIEGLRQTLKSAY